MSNKWKSDPRNIVLAQRFGSPLLVQWIKGTKAWSIEDRMLWLKWDYKINLQIRGHTLHVLLLLFCLLSMGKNKTPSTFKHQAGCGHFYKCDKIVLLIGRVFFILNFAAKDSQVITITLNWTWRQTHSQRRCYNRSVTMPPVTCASQQSGCSILNQLKFLNALQRQTHAQCIVIIQTGSNEGMGHHTQIRYLKEWMLLPHQL